MHLTTKAGRRIKLPEAKEDAAINAGIAADPDTYELGAEEFAQMRPVGRPPAENPRRSTTIRFEEDVLLALKASGKGWQTRVNEMVRREIFGR